MLAYILAIGVGLGSFTLYMAAFFFPEVHRRNDFIWSGVGLFYALVLWLYAPRITGGMLLGQVAGVALLGWLGWQTFWLRRQIAPLDQQTPIPSTAELQAGFRSVSNSAGRSPLIDQVTRAFQQVKEGVQATVATTTQVKSSPPLRPGDVYVPPSLEEFGTAGQEATQRFARVQITEVEASPDHSSRLTTPAIESARATRESAASRSASPLAGMKVKGRGRMEAAARQQAIAPEPNPSQTPISSSPPGSPAPSPSRPASANGAAGQPWYKGFSKKKESKPVYVRKQYRDAETKAPTVQKAEIVPLTQTQTIEPTSSTPATPTNLQVEVIAEVVTEELVPDLLGNTPYEITAAEIVEELLEDISAQEAGAKPTNLGDGKVEYETVELQNPLG